ncbi:MAG TPA: DegT/DnrJ/EryC1/StrS family aminotransferase [Chitinispirillaceae bacterium]|nr:DegT/DnrJ/EryC1/StrS family aminotransferase [Chitinispirillaceae bacterium]
MNESIPFLNLEFLHKPLEQEFVNAFRKNLSSQEFSNSNVVKTFEQEFACFCGTRYAIGVGSGTDALRFALIAAGVKYGDMVITVPNTFIATTEAISQAGAMPVFIDIDEKTFNMSPDKLEEYLYENCFVDHITEETIHTKTGKPVRAIVPVHLYGQIADMDKIKQIAVKYDLTVIEDSCQAQGAVFYGKSCIKKAGAIGKAGAFSFYPANNLGAVGEAGAVTTDDEQMADKIKMLRDHGQNKKNNHEFEGYNGRLDTIQASILKVKLQYLNIWNDERRKLARKYKEMLKGISQIETPCEKPFSKSVYHLYVIRCNSDRDKLRENLKRKKIGTGLHYPVPLHLQKAYRFLGYRKGCFPFCEKVSEEILSLPMYPGLKEDQQLKITEQIKKFYDKRMNNYL